MSDKNLPAGRTEEPAGYYRTAPDKQVVIKRTEEQQRIVDEYFIVKKYKVTTCDPELQKKANTAKLVSNILLWPGIGLAVLGIAVDMILLTVIGAIAAIAGIVCKVVNKKLIKRFEESIKVTVGPKKLMSDEEYEQLVREKIESMNIAELGLEKLGLDPDQVKEINPIIIQDQVITDTSFTVRNETTHALHSSTQYVTYLYFTDEELFVYKIQFDMCCNTQDEWTSEFFYKDICDVSSYTRLWVMKN